MFKHSISKVKIGAAKCGVQITSRVQNQSHLGLYSLITLTPSDILNLIYSYLGKQTTIRFSRRVNDRLILLLAESAMTRSSFTVAQSYLSLAIVEQVLLYDHALFWVHGGLVPKHLSVSYLLDCTQVDSLGEREGGKQGKGKHNVGRDKGQARVLLARSMKSISSTVRDWVFLSQEIHATSSLALLQHCIGRILCGFDSREF